MKPFVQLSLIAALLWATTLGAQNPGTPFRVNATALYDGTNVIVRWVPADFATWQYANEYGYTLTRTTIRLDGTPLSVEDMQEKKITIGTDFKPLPENEWESLADQDDMAGVIAGCIYGDSMEVVDLAHSDMLSIVDANRSRENRFGFALFAADQSLDLAIAAGLGYLDNDVVVNSEYVYVAELNSPPSGMTVEKAFGIVQTQKSSLPVPAEFKAVAGNFSAILSWEKDALAGYYSSYLVERSDDGGNNFQPVNAAPFMSLSTISKGETPNTFLDSLPKNFYTYYYRVRGKSPFGVLGPPSDTVDVMGRPDPVAANPEIYLVETVGSDDVKLNWNFPQELELQLVEFEILRSETTEGEFLALGTVPYNAREYVDTDPFPAGYYIVVAKDVNGHSQPSLPMLGQPADATPPAVPTGLTGACDINGVVTLSWNRNTENDLAGYRVFQSDNGGDSTFLQITKSPVADSVYRFNVTLENLTENMYFAISAVDYRYNQSPMSAYIIVKRADILAPTAAVISKVMERREAVELEIIPSSSSDVVRYTIQKREEHSPEWQTLDEFTVQTMPHNYIDSISYLKKINRRRWYYYRVLAEDEEGNLGSCKPWRAHPNDGGIRDSLEGFTVTYLTGDNTVRLAWYYPEDIDLSGFQIYRGIDTSQMRSYKAVHISQVLATDPGSNNLKYYVFDDVDTEFNNTKIPVQTFYAQPDAGGGSPVPVKPTAFNQPMNPNQQTISNVTLKYQVMGIFADGAVTPLTWPQSVVVPQL